MWPEKRVQEVGAIGSVGRAGLAGTTHDLTFRVYANRDAARVTVLCPKVGDPSLLREKGVNCRQAPQLRLANNFSFFIEPDRLDEIPS
jgi:hypothetical protein